MDLDEYILAYENDAVVCFTPEDKRVYENSVTGRNDLLADCTENERLDLYDKVLEVWGKTPTVEAITAPTLEELKTQKKTEIAAARYELEIAGTMFNGVTIDTGRDSQALITGAALAAMLDEGYSLNWKTAAGFIHLSAPEIIAVAQAVRAHVQSCFDREGELVAQVDAAQTAEELDAIEITFE